MKALHASITKNQEDFIICQEDMMLRQEGMIKKQTKYIQQLAVYRGKVEEIIKSLQQSQQNQPRSESTESDNLSPSLKRQAGEAISNTYQVVARNVDTTPLKVVDSTKVQHITFKRKTKKPKFIKYYTNPCKKFRKVLNGVKVDPDKPMNTKALETY